MIQNTRKTILNRRLPASFGIVGLVVSLATIAWLSGNAILFGTKAANGNIPRSVQISNISDSSFTVSYTTDQFAIGTVAYGTDNKLGKVGLDDRDQQVGSPVSHRVHHITLKQLTPSTKYFFSISSADQTFTQDGQLYSITTAPTSTSQPSSQAPAAGTVALEDGSIPAEGLVYLISKESQLLSTLLKPDGGYLLPLNTIRSKDLSKILLLAPDTTLTMNVTDSSEQSKMSILASQSNPVPRIILSKNYEFTANDAAIETANTPIASDSGFPKEEDTSQVSSPEIITPENEAVLQDQKPQFAGKALPNETIAIGILSEDDKETKTTVTADANGNWEYRPTVALTPGVYTITIASVDASGAIQTLTNTFTVNASGSQFAQPSISPSLSPSFGVTPTASPTPTVELSPTAIPTIVTPTISPTIASMSGIPTQPPIPQSGSSSVLMVAMGTGLSIIIGALLFFLTRGSITV